MIFFIEPSTMVLSRIIIFLALIVTCSADFSGFSDCLSERTNGGYKVETELFTKQIRDMKLDFDDLKAWKDTICKETVIPESQKFLTVVKECIKEHQMDKSLMDQESKLPEENNQFCEMNIADAVCSNNFKVDTSKINLEIVHDNFCDIHMGLFNYFNNLYGKCFLKRKEALRHAEFHVYKLYLENDNKDELNYQLRSECQTNDFYQCIRGMSNSGLKVAPELFTKNLESMKLNVNELKTWKDSICTKTVIPESENYLRTVRKCGRETEVEESIYFHESELSERYIEFCDMDITDAVCYDKFNVNMKPITLESVGNTFCPLHMGLHDYFIGLYKRCPAKRKIALDQAQSYVHQLFLDSPNKDTLHYNTFEECQVQYFYQCILDCANDGMDNIQSNATEKAFDMKSYCTDSSFYNTKSSCIDECTKYHSGSAIELTTTKTFIQEQCGKNADNLQKCELPGDVFNRASNCEDTATIQIQLTACIGEETAKAFNDDFLFTWAGKDLNKYHELKKCGFVAYPPTTTTTTTTTEATTTTQIITTTEEITTAEIINSGNDTTSQDVNGNQTTSLNASGIVGSNNDGLDYTNSHHSATGFCHSCFFEAFVSQFLIYIFLNF